MGSLPKLVAGARLALVRPLGNDAAMQIALFSSLALNDVSQTPAEVMDGTCQAVRMADEMGFDVAWFVEHHFSAFSICASPLMMAMHCAGFTKNIRLGPAVLVLPLHEPLRMIQEIGLLDIASGGRAVVGIGTGHQPHEFRSMGVPMDERYERFLESWDVLDMAWRDGRVTFQGEHLHIPETLFSAMPVGGRQPELFVATHDPRLMGRAAARGATVFISAGPRPSASAVAARQQVVDAAAALGVSESRVKLAVQRYVFVSEDRAVIREAAEHMVHFMRRMRSLRDEYPARDGLHFHSIPFDGEPDVDTILAHAPVGDPETVAERLAADVAALSPHQLSIHMTYTGLPQSTVLRSLELFGTRVLPHLRKTRFA
jgi:alkanesulfonate monooxygenase SsuD/methylene tetrahydromethanopterin reductase-like flavin-dependent oxidoreductase (luciferase family)